MKESFFNEEMEKSINKASRKGITINKRIYNFAFNKLKENKLETFKIGSQKYHIYKSTYNKYYFIYSKKRDAIIDWYNEEDFTFQDNEWIKNKVKRNRRYIKAKEHAITRAMERFALLISDQDYENLNKMIQEGNALFLMKGDKKEKSNDLVSFYKVSFNNSEYIILYSEKFKHIISFYHDKWLSQDEEGNWKHNKSSKYRKNEKRTRNRKTHRIKDTSQKKYNRKKMKLTDL